MAAFALAIGYVLTNEGGWSDHPADRGGKTKYGITHALAAEYGIPNVRTLSLVQAKEIYRLHYWEHAQLEKVENQRVATKALDMLVNFGRTGGAKAIQRAVGAQPDGVIGPKTLAALNDCTEEQALERLSKAAGERYVNIVMKDATQLVFLPGWINRAIERP